VTLPNFGLNNLHHNPKEHGPAPLIEIYLTTKRLLSKPLIENFIIKCEHNHDGY
jgi:hypothetical protein